MVYAEFGGQTECIMGNWKIENQNITDLSDRNSKQYARQYVDSVHSLKSYIATKCSRKAKWYLLESYTLQKGT